MALEHSLYTCHTEDLCLTQSTLHRSLGFHLHIRDVPKLTCSLANHIHQTDSVALEHSLYTCHTEDLCLTQSTLHRSLGFHLHIRDVPKLTCSLANHIHQTDSVALEHSLYTCHTEDLCLTQSTLHRSLGFHLHIRDVPKLTCSLANHIHQTDSVALEHSLYTCHTEDLCLTTGA